MPELIPFSEEQIQEMRQMRWAGASLREIAGYFSTSASTVLSYVRGVKPQPNGKELEYTPKDLIYDWLPALPHEGLPLPRWFATWMQERLRSKRHVPPGSTYSTESEDDDRRRRR